MVVASSGKELGTWQVQDISSGGSISCTALPQALLIHDSNVLVAGKGSRNEVHVIWIANMCGPMPELCSTPVTDSCYLFDVHYPMRDTLDIPTGDTDRPPLLLPSDVIGVFGGGAGSIHVCTVLMRLSPGVLRHAELYDSGQGYSTSRRIQVHIKHPSTLYGGFRAISVAAN